MGKILVVDDEESICDILSMALKKDGYEVASATNPLHALDLCDKEEFDVVIQDLRMPEMDGIELLKRIKEKRGDRTSVIIMTAYSTWERAVEAMRLGAFGYFQKPFDTQIDVRTTVSRALQLKYMHDEMQKTFDEVMQTIGVMIGNSRKMGTVYDVIRKSAPTDSTILISGESGVGKELVAKALHFGSPRCRNRFVTVNCGEFTETLLESELFGHAKGSFTGAVSDKEGILHYADGGTFFLDEVGDMSLQLQVKLLRVLEEREYKPVGSVQSRKIDVRFITATNRDLEAEVKEGRFRRDLFYRLNVIPIQVPPLRERKEDIPLLAGHFLALFSKQIDKQVSGFSARARERLMSYDWPGNVRELENIIQRAVTLTEGNEIANIDVFLQGRSSETNVAPMLSEQGVVLDDIVSDVEKSYLLKALAISNNNYTKAAQMLNMSLRSFRYKIRKYGIEVK